MVLNKLFKKQKGFTLLFASLIVSLLLAVGLSILNITLAQLVLSSAAKESQFAFYNADTGVECGLFYDKNGPNGRIFATSSNSTNLLTSVDISCNNAHPIDPGPQVTFPDSATAVTSFDLAFVTNECRGGGSVPVVHLEITKTTAQSQYGPITYTTILSRGYNNCNASDPRRVERGLVASY